MLHNFINQLTALLIILLCYCCRFISLKLSGHSDISKGFSPQRTDAFFGPCKSFWIICLSGTNTHMAGRNECFSLAFYSLHKSWETGCSIKFVWLMLPCLNLPQVKFTVNLSCILWCSHFKTKESRKIPSILKHQLHFLPACKWKTSCVRWSQAKGRYNTWTETVRTSVDDDGL